MQKVTYLAKKDTHLTGDIAGYIYSGDKKSYFIYKKAHRIASAIFLVSNIIKDSIGLRNELQQCSLELMNYMIAIKEKHFDLDVAFIEPLKLIVFKIAGLLELAMLSMLISEMNYKLITVELEKLINIVSSKRTVQTGLNMGYFIGDKLFGNKSGSVNTKYNPNRTVASEEGIQKAHSEGNTNKGVLYKKPNQEERRSTILNIIKDKRVVSIKDIFVIISNCSEKTLQRELLSMVSAGILKKQGERRWSRYSVAEKAVNLSEKISEKI